MAENLFHNGTPVADSYAGHPELYYDQATAKMVYPDQGSHEVDVYDAIQGPTIAGEFVDTFGQPFVSCEWAE